MTIDEEIAKLDDNIRRLKIEYEAYFNGGLPRPPHETAFRVERTIKKYGDASKLNYGQRFRFNQLVQRYAVNNDLWRKRLKDKVEQLFKAVVAAKRQVGERVDNIDLVAFARLVSEKTRQIKKSLGCAKVQFSVAVEDGKFKFKAVKFE